MLCGIEPAEVSPIVLQFGVDDHVLDASGGNVERERLPHVDRRLEALDLQPVHHDVEAVGAESESGPRTGDGGRIVGCDQIKVLQRVMRGIGNVRALPTSPS